MDCKRTPLGLIEAACIEFLPQKIRFINKLQKTYTEIPYSKASIIGLSGINYNVLEAIFLNYTFLPDGRLAYKGLKEMSIKDVGGDSLSKEQKHVQYMKAQFPQCSTTTTTLVFWYDTGNTYRYTTTLTTHCKKRRHNKGRRLHWRCSNRCRGRQPATIVPAISREDTSQPRRMVETITIKDRPQSDI